MARHPAPVDARPRPVEHQKGRRPARKGQDCDRGGKKEERALGIKTERETNMKGRRTASPRAVIPPPARKGSDTIPLRLAPRWNSLRAQKNSAPGGKKEERPLGIKPEKETNIKGRRTASPRAPAKDAEEEGAGAQPTGTPADRQISSRDRSDAIPPRLAPRRNSLWVQKEKKEERALGIKIEKKLLLRDDVPRPPGL